MIYLLASIFSSSMIYVIFRVAKNYSCQLLQLITINYLAASILGILLFQPFTSFSIQQSSNWIPFAVLLGVLFIAMFFLIGNSSQKAGITITTLANKLSLVFPVLFSLVYFNEQISTLNYIGLSTAFIAILLTIYRKERNRTKLGLVVLPIFIFLGSGCVDSIVKYVQAVKITDSEISLYTIVVFLVSFLCGFAIISFSRPSIRKINGATILLGILLGAANFGSLFFLLNALNKSGMESSLVFALNNMSIVAFTALVGTLIFKEQLNRINFAGIVLAIISLYFLL